MTLFRHRADEIHEQEAERRRRDRDAAGIARRRADEVEAERRREWERIQVEGLSQMRRPEPVRPDPADQAAARAAAAQAEQDRRHRYRVFRDQVVQAAMGARSQKDSAVASEDVEGFVSAFARLSALEALLNQLDSEERTRQQLAATPIMHGAVRL